MEASECTLLPREDWDGTIRDNVSIVVYCRGEECATPQRFLLVERNGLLHLPRREVSTRESSLWPKDVNYSDIAVKLVSGISSGDDPQLATPLVAKLIMLTRIYVPTFGRHYNHYVFAIHVSGSALQEFEQREEVKVLSAPELKRLPESKIERQDIILLADCIDHQIRDGSDVGAIIREFGPHLIWRQVSEDEMTSEDCLIRSPGYREQDVEMLFEEFVKYSYPHNTVCLRDVKTLFSDLGFRRREDLLFRALDRQKIGELGCKEFLYGLAAIDPVTSHGKGPAELRCRYIFKYYDDNKDDILEVSEVKNMVHDIAQLHGQDITAESIDEKTAKAFEIFGVSEESGVPLANFLVSVGNLRFRGTSLLLRASTSVLQHTIHKLGNSSRKRQAGSPFRSPKSSEFLHKKLRKSLPPESSKVASSNASSSENNGMLKGDVVDNDVHMKYVGSSSSGSLPLSEGAFQSPERASYTLAQHTVKVRRSGQITDIHLLLDMERAGEVCDTGLDVDDPVLTDFQPLTPFKKGNSRFHSGVSESPRQKLIDRFQSVEAFNTKSLTNEMITALRFFEHGNSKKPAFDWGEVDLVKLGQYIITLCAATKECVETEPRLLRLSTPCYILGDIHGNYRDLVCFEKALWRVGPHLTPANFLFLGDYVDRGDYGLEVIAYLFAQKVQAPQKFFLLRGNHEVREIQQMFTFHDECLKKLGDRLGLKVWNAINEVFDCMPLAAVVDKKIFCIHGGIPQVNGSLRELEKIPCPLPNPENESNLAWQMMWNDPIAAEEMNEEVREQLTTNDGFAFNVKRQTAFVFNHAAFDSFLTHNGLTHVVRAHEVKEAGFEIQQSGRLMTVFSSSHYCGGSNEAACILVHNYRMRIIRIDTS